jgi:16S rRNA (adenine(1408)-N(1))-methyltransferase
VQSAVETLPAELEGVADEVHVNFPWGSLLRGVVVADHPVLRMLRSLCSNNALLKVVVGFDGERDRGELEAAGVATIICYLHKRNGGKISRSRL